MRCQAKAPSASGKYSKSKKPSKTAQLTIHAEPNNVRADHDIYLISESGFAVAATTSPESPVLREFYDAYDLAFTLTNEKEEFAGFADCLALNQGEIYAGLSAHFGGFREYAATIRAPVTGEFIGGMNFIVLQMGGLKIPQAPYLSVNLNYVFINGQARRRGYFRAIMREFAPIVMKLFAASNPTDVQAALQRHYLPNPPVYIYIELNDPVRMSKEDYDTDTQISGLDQTSRIGIWGSLGAKIIDFPYVQPALSAKQKADPNLVYAVLGVEGGRLHPSNLRAHLERFFTISVLKGRCACSDPYAAAQLSALSKLSRNFESIRLLDLRKLDFSKDLVTTANAGSLREMLNKTSFAHKV